MYVESKKTNKLNEETNKLVPCTEKLLSVTKMLFGTRNRCYFSLLTKKKHTQRRTLIKLNGVAAAHMPHDRSRRISNLNCLHMLVDTIDSSQFSLAQQCIHNALSSRSFFYASFRLYDRRSERVFHSSFLFCRSYAHRMIKNFSQWNYCFAC